MLILDGVVKKGYRTSYQIYPRRKEYKSIYAAFKWSRAYLGWRRCVDTPALITRSRWTIFL